MVRATALRDQHDDAGGYCHGEQAGYSVTIMAVRFELWERALRSSLTE